MDVEAPAIVKEHFIATYRAAVESVTSVEGLKQLDTDPLLAYVQDAGSMAELSLILGMRDMSGSLADVKNSMSRAAYQEQR